MDVAKETVANKKRNSQKNTDSAEESADSVMDRLNEIEAEIQKLKKMKHEILVQECGRTSSILAAEEEEAVTCPIKHAARAEHGKRHIAGGVGRISDLVVTSAKGSWVNTYCGKKYLDMTAGIGVVNTGHCHPRVVKAAQEQCGQIVHAQVNISFHEPMLKLVDKLLTITPKGLDTFFFWNSGAEAVEASIKLAKMATGRNNIIVFQGGYHGRTFGTMSLTTSKTIYRAGFGGLLPGVFVAPFPYRTQLGKAFDKLTDEELEDHCIEQLVFLLKMQTTAGDTAAIISEPILGEGGYVAPPKNFFKKVKALCDKEGILFIADEVQTGFGRTGKMFAVEHFGVIPDILVMAKGLASGFPLSCIASRHELMSKQPAGSMGGTYAGNAVSCAAALETIKVMEDEKLLENTNARGAQFRQGLEELRKRYPVIKDVRGHGLMIGVELDKDKVPYGTAAAISRACRDEGMLLLNTSSFEALRFIPPLTVTEEEVKIALEKFEKAMSSVLA